MLRRLLSLFAIASVFCGGCSSVFRTPKPATLLWSDEFNGTALDLYHPQRNPNGRWRPLDYLQDIDSPGYVDFTGSTSFNVNPWHPPMAAYSPFIVSDGTLKIKAQRLPPELRTLVNQVSRAQGYPPDTVRWLTGWLTAYPFFNGPGAFTYGYYECRCRAPNAKGSSINFWLFSSGQNAAIDKNNGELDIFENLGRSDRWFTNLHPNDNAGNGSGQQWEHNQDTLEFHTYAMDWQPAFIRIYRDNELQQEITGPLCTWYNGVKMRIMIGVWFDATWYMNNPAMSSDASTPSPNYAEFDYVRVYDRKP